MAKRREASKRIDPAHPPLPALEPDGSAEPSPDVAAVLGIRA